MGVSPLNEFSLFPILADLNNGMQKHLPESSRDAFTMVVSASISNLPLVFAKSFLYVRDPETLKTDQFSSFLSSRVNYFEYALLSMGSLFHNVLMTVTYVALYVITFGQSRHTKYSLYKHWNHCYFSAVGVGVGFSGAASPTFADELIQKVFGTLWNTVKGDYRRDLRHFEQRLVAEIKSIYKQNQSQILDAVYAYTQDEYRYGLLYPFLREFGKKLQSPSIKTLEALYDLALSAYEKCSQMTVYRTAPPVKFSEDFSLAPMLADLNETLRNYMPISSSRAFIIAESVALHQLAMAVSKTILYVGKAKELRINDPFHFLSSRFSFIEAAAINIANLVHQCAMSLLYAGLFVATLGLNRDISYSFKKHLHHVLYSFLGTGIALAGTVAPVLGAYFTLVTFTLLWRWVRHDFAGDKALFEKPFVKEFKRIYFENREHISKAVTYYLNNKSRSDKVLLFLAEFERRVPEVVDIDGLVLLVKDIISNYSIVMKTPPTSPIFSPEKRRSARGNQA